MPEPVTPHAFCSYPRSLTKQQGTSDGQHATSNDNQHVVTAGPYAHSSERGHDLTFHRRCSMHAGDCDSSTISIQISGRSLTVLM
jgi:hypothetical protein